MIPFFDIKTENDEYINSYHQALDGFLNEGQFILGEPVKRFEADYALYCQVKYCVGVSSGLDALRLIFESYIRMGKLKKGDQVLVPAHTYVATTLSVIHSGLIPVFVEPDKNGYNVSLETVTSAYNNSIKAILVVHIYGELVEMQPIIEFAESNGLLLIEDAAQAHGAMNADGVRAGALGDAAAFSFYPTKNLGALGDAGSVTTNNKELADTIRTLRNYGSQKRYYNKFDGFNMRLDALQANFLKIKLKDLCSKNKRRQEIAWQYVNEVDNPKIKLPFHPHNDSHVFHLFVVQVESRDKFVNYLSHHDIETLVHYPIPPHKQEALSDYREISLPRTENYHQKVVSLPIYPSLKAAQMDHIIEVLNKY